VVWQKWTESGKSGSFILTKRNDVAIQVCWQWAVGSGTVAAVTKNEVNDVAIQVCWQWAMALLLPLQLRLSGQNVTM
jgi:hypothetical protein